ncbi:acyltransferase family protein, partial [Paraburkholderia sp. SIMBA_054]|uniref:acyltransferase family protein n=1 Tax=Paraburkholderia sp. SIMBA_054 TaxID=3085795 RepID=UPI00397C7BD0
LTKIDSVKEFFKRRALRLYPAYIVAVIITFVAVKVYDLKGRGVSLSDAIVNLTMLQGHLLIPHVDGAYWSLTVELTFYIIMGFFLY